MVREVLRAGQGLGFSSKSNEELAKVFQSALWQIWESKVGGEGNHIGGVAIVQVRRMGWAPAGSCGVASRGHLEYSGGAVEGLAAAR